MYHAHYKEQELAQYRGNPLIEALPPIPADEIEVLQHLVGIVNICTPEEKRLKPFLRIHLLNKNRSDFFFPFGQVQRLDTLIHMMIRGAYMNRNPILPEYRSMLSALDKGETWGARDHSGINFVPEMGTVIYGVSGSGKSRGLYQCLKYYPSLIRHTEYQGQPFTRTQLPWLMVEAPYDGNYVTFCRTVFQEIDKRCGTNNLDKYGYSTYSVSTMILHMQKLLLLYNVGILIIDEVQNLLRCKNNSDEMLAFFVSLTNQLSVPIIYCGTSNAIRLFQSRMSLARRQTGAGDMKFEAIKRSSSEWVGMMEYLWRGYVLQEEILLDDKMLDAFWRYSQGLIGVVVALFCLVQIRALQSGRESFDIQSLQKVYDKDMALIKPMLEAIKSGKEWQIAQYEDMFIDIGATINAGIKESVHQEEPEKGISGKSLTVAQRLQSVADRLYTKIRDIDLCEDVEDNELKAVINQVVKSASDDMEEGKLLKAVVLRFLQPKKLKCSGKKISVPRNSGLLYILEQSEKNKTDIHDDLLECGFIKRIEDDYPDLAGVDNASVLRRHISG